jgi:hypothetical protein
MSELAYSTPANKQSRITVVAPDDEGNPVELDAGAYHITIVEGDGTFEYNPETNGLVTRSGTIGQVTHYQVKIDGQPGEGPDPSGYIPLDLFEMATAVGAVDVSASVSLEDRGTPA